MKYSKLFIFVGVFCVAQTEAIKDSASSKRDPIDFQLRSQLSKSDLEKALTSCLHKLTLDGIVQELHYLERQNRVIKEFPHPSSLKQIYTVDPCSATAFGISADFRLMITNLETGEIEHLIEESNNLSYLVGEPSPSGKKVALTSCDTGNVIFYDRDNKELKVVYERPSSLHVPYMAIFSPNEKFLAVMLYESRLKDLFFVVLDLETGTEVPSLKISKETEMVTFSQDSKMLITGDSSGNVSLLDLTSGSCVKTFYDVTCSSIHKIACVAKDTKIFVGGSAGDVVLIDTIEDSKTVIVPKGAIDCWLSTLLCIEEGKKVLVQQSTDSTSIPACLYDVETKACLWTLPQEFSDFVLSPDGTHLYAFNGWLNVSNAILLFDLELISPLQWLKEHVNMEQAVFISKAYKAYKEGNPLEIISNSDDYKALMSIDDKDVRLMLVRSFNLKVI